jgi:CBS domain containing-hemolysin-like protein
MQPVIFNHCVTLLYYFLKYLLKNLCSEIGLDAFIIFFFTKIPNIKIITNIDRVPEMMPLYDILNEFQKGHSHMAVVVRHFDKTEQQTTNNNCSGN